MMAVLQYLDLEGNLMVFSPGSDFSTERQANQSVRFCHVDRKSNNRLRRISPTVLIDPA